jgi:hypothetical protein
MEEYQNCGSDAGSFEVGGMHIAVLRYAEISVL